MVLYGKQYCDIDPSDLCITQDKKNRAKKPYDEQGNDYYDVNIKEWRLQQIEKQNRQKETEDRTENEHEKMTGKIRLKEDTDLHQTQVLQGLEKGKQNAESVTVIHDVIEEVFS